MIKVVVIEDENVSSNYIVSLLDKFCPDKFIVEKQIDNIVDSIKWFIDNDYPDLIFMDINLSDGLCFEIFNKIEVNCPIIFTSAFSEYAVKVFRTNVNNVIDYLLKPIKEEDFSFAISKFLKIKKGDKNSFKKINNSENDNNLKKAKERFLVKLGNKYTPIKVEDIAYFYKDDIVFIRAFNGNSYPINRSLSQIESELNLDMFFRVNRKVIINFNAIEYLSQYKPGQLVIKLNPKFEEMIVLSQEKSSSIKALLN